MNDFPYTGPTAGAMDLQERQQRQQREIEKPIICESCGSNWFSTVVFEQYSDIAFGSGTGGDIRSISNMPQTIRVCLCGRPYSPNLTGVRGRAATQELASFQDALKTAQNFLKIIADTVRRVVQQPSPTFDQISQNFATIKEFVSFKDQVSQSRLSGGENLPAAVSAPAVETPGAAPVSPEALAPDAQAEPHPNSREGKALKAERLRKQLEIDQAAGGAR